jgi:hypothetical protein
VIIVEDETSTVVTGRFTAIIGALGYIELSRRTKSCRIGVIKEPVIRRGRRSAF